MNTKTKLTGEHEINLKLQNLRKGVKTKGVKPGVLHGFTGTEFDMTNSKALDYRSRSTECTAGKQKAPILSCTLLGVNVNPALCYLSCQTPYL